MGQIKRAMPVVLLRPFEIRSWLRLMLFVVAFGASGWVFLELDQSTRQVAAAESLMRTALDAQRQQAETVALKAAMQQRKVIDQAYGFLRVIGGLSSISNMRRESCEGLLRRQLEYAPAFGNLGISTRDGRILCATQPVPVPLRFNPIMQENSFVVPDWGFADGRKRAGIVLVSPIIDNGNYLGSVFSVLDPARLLQGGSGTVSLSLLTSANVIMSTASHSALKLSPRRDDNPEPVMGLDGVQRVYAFVPLIEEAAQTVYLAAAVPFRPGPAAAHQQVYTRGIILILLLALATYLAGIGRDAFLRNFVADLGSAGRSRAQFHVGRIRLRWRAGIAKLRRRQRAEEARRRSQTKIELREANEALKKTLERFEQRDREMAVLNEFSRHLQTCSHADEIHSTVAQFSQQLFAGAGGALYLAGSAGAVIETQRSWGTLSLQKNVIAPDDCWALRLCKAHCVAGPDAGLQCSHVIESPPAGYTCMPLLSHGEILGMLHLQTPASQAGGTPSAAPSLERAQDFAERAALALANLALRETLRVQSIRDALTGLYNRRFLEETLTMEEQRAQRSGSPIGVAMIDIDHFKIFNDRFGHPAGDALLRELGSCLRAQVREGDTACRYGGEEFTLILPGATVDIAQQRAEVLRARVAQLAVEYQGCTLGPVTLSIGVASYPQHGASWREVLTSADHALYRAKRDGRNRVLSA